MVRPQVTDGGTTCNVEGSCEYIESAVADNRQGVVPQLGGWGEVQTAPHHTNASCYDLFTQAGSGTCECGNEPSGSIKCGKFLD